MKDKIGCGSKNRQNRVNSQGYVESKYNTPGSKQSVGRDYTSYRNWHLVKHDTENTGVIYFGRISFPKEMIGKRVRLKIELVD